MIGVVFLGKAVVGKKSAVVGGAEYYLASLSDWEEKRWLLRRPGWRLMP